MIVPPDAAASRSLNLNQQLRLVGELVRLVRARLPLEKALAELAGHGPAPLAQSANVLLQRLSHGEPLSHSLAPGVSRSSRMLACAVDIGQWTNRLDESLASWTQLVVNQRLATRRLRVAMVYPSLLVCVALVSLGYTAWHLIPLYAVAFESIGSSPPAWFGVVRWIGQHLVIGMAVLLLTLLLAIVWWLRRGNRFNRSGVPLDPSARLYHQAHVARLASIVLSSGRPMAELPSILSGASGAKTPTGLAAPGHYASTIIGPETSSVLAALEAGVLPHQESVKLLMSLATEIENRANNQAARRARWMPMLMSLLVGLIVIVVYVGLIYLPWIAIFHHITNHAR